MTGKGSGRRPENNAAYQNNHVAAYKPLCKYCGEPADQMIQSMHPECRDKYRDEWLKQANQDTLE